MHQEMLRRMALIISSAGMNGGSVVKKFDKLWPSPSKISTHGSVDEKARKVLQTFKEIEAAKKIKNARGA